MRRKTLSNNERFVEGTRKMLSLHEIVATSEYYYSIIFVQINHMFEICVRGQTF